MKRRDLFLRTTIQPIVSASMMAMLLRTFPSSMVTTKYQVVVTIHR